MKRLKIIRLVAWCAVAVAAGLLLGMSGLVPGQPRERTVVLSGVAAVGGPFELTSHKGERVNNERLAGKPYLVFFGFTHCPDVCPTTLFEITDLIVELGPVSENFNVIFITVDPERDTQALLAEYMASFNPRIMALRGSRPDTDTALKAFAGYARKVPMEGDQYTMDHTAGVYMIDAGGKFAGMIDMHEPRETRLRKLRRLAGADRGRSSTEVSQ